MEFDRRICSQARKTRDPRFDGRIFIGVLTSGVYCRPICPAPSATEKSVRYYASAAAAAEAGSVPACDAVRNVHGNSRVDLELPPRFRGPCA